MPAERYFKDIQFHQNDALIFEDDEFHHLVRVMRNQTGDAVEIINGKGQLATAKIVNIEKRMANLKILNVTEEPMPKTEFIIAQAIPRPNRLDFILEKCTELGMTEIMLFPGELSEKKSFNPQQKVRMQNLLIAAMKQCGRLHLPKITILPEIKEWKPFAYPSYFGDLTSKDSLQKYLNKQKIEKGIVFIVGPESGLSESEIKILKKIGSTGVKLHPNTLRTDTASIVALSIITHFQFDLENKL